MNIEEKIRLHLAAYRSKHGKNQKQMADVIGISYSTYQELEKGKVKTLDVLNKLKNTTGFNEKNIPVEGFAGDEIIKLTKTTIELRAFVNVLQSEVVKLSAKKEGQTFETRLSELQTRTDAEYARLYKEYLEKQGQDQE